MKNTYDAVKKNDVQSLQWKKETARIGGEIDSVLLIGQSNMSGRGIIGSVPPIDPRDMMFMLRNGRWQPMTEPITTDRKIFVECDTEFRSGDRFEIASVKDLTLSPDGIHFSGASYRILGRRYFEAFDKAKNRMSEI